MKKTYSHLIIGLAAFLFGLVIAIGGLALAGQPSTGLQEHISHASDTTTPPITGDEDEQFEWDCGCTCDENLPAANNGTDTWLLALLGMILLAILVVLIFRRSSPQIGQGRAKQGKGDADLQNLLLMQQSQAQTQAHYSQPAAPQPGYAAPQPRESITDQMLGQARARVGSSTAGQGGQRSGSASSSSTAQSPSRSSSSSSSAQSPSRSSSQSSSDRQTPPSQGGYRQ